MRLRLPGVGDSNVTCFSGGYKQAKLLVPPIHFNIQLEMCISLRIVHLNGTFSPGKA